MFSRKSHKPDFHVAIDEKLVFAIILENKHFNALHHSSIINVVMADVLLCGHNLSCLPGPKLKCCGYHQLFKMIDVVAFLGCITVPVLSCDI